MLDWLNVLVIANNMDFLEYSYTGYQALWCMFDIGQGADPRLFW
jgi:hypothetical protein